MTPEADPTLVARLQDYLRQSAAQRYSAVPLPPFTAFIDDTDPLPFFNYAIPDRPMREGDSSGLDTLTESLDALSEVFTSRGRIPRLEYIESYAPALEARLLSAGFTEESRLPLMTCDRLSPGDASYLHPTRVLGPQSSSEDLAAMMALQRRAFDVPDRPVTAADVEQLRHSLRRGRGAVQALVDGAPVGAASFSEIASGLTEIAGVATDPGHRRRGIGAAVVTAAVREAFACGAELAVLSAAEGAEGVYLRAGFQRVATILAHRRDPGGDARGPD